MPGLGLADWEVDDECGLMRVNVATSWTEAGQVAFHALDCAGRLPCLAEPAILALPLAGQP